MFDKLYTANNLNDYEIAAYEEHITVIGPYLEKWQDAWSKAFPNDTSYIKKLGGLLAWLESDQVAGDKKSYVKLLFSTDFLEHKVTKVGDSEIHKLNINQHIHIRSELEIMAKLLQNDFLIELDTTKLPSGKNSEYFVSNGSIEFHVEAKYIDDDGLDAIFFREDNDDGSSVLGEKQEREIRELFRAQIKEAVRKFRGYDGYYLLAIGTNKNINSMGQKVFDYLTKNRSPSQNELGVLFNESLRFSLVQNDKCPVSISEYLNH